MRHALIKTVTFLLSLAILLSMFTACGNKQDAAAMDAVVDAAVKAALEATVTSNSVTIVDTDGRHITIEDANGKNLQQLLEMAKVTLQEKDLLTVETDQVFPGNLTIRVCRSCTVTIAVAAEEPLSYTVILPGGTVADAIAAVGVTLTDMHTVNYQLSDLLADGMEICIAEKAPEIEETEPTEATEPENTGSSNNSSNNNTGSNNTQPQPTEPKPTEPAPTEPAPTEPAPTEPERTVVSVEVYEDCDGSGHGVKVITYSDGTQEEVYF